jgi:hypothetical protein
LLARGRRTGVRAGVELGDVILAVNARKSTVSPI